MIRGDKLPWQQGSTSKGNEGCQTRTKAAGRQPLVCNETPTRPAVASISPPFVRARDSQALITSPAKSHFSAFGFKG